MSPSWRLCPILVVLTCAGCATTSRQAAFQPVQHDVSSLSGQRVTWNQETADDQRAEEQVRRLLQEPLGASAAAQIALLNNPDLQATFEEIGISQAELVQAGLLKNPTFTASWRFPDAGGIVDAEYQVAQDFLSVALIPLKRKVAAAQLQVAEDHVTHEVLHLIAQVKTEFYTYQAENQLGSRLKLIVQADQAGVDLAQAQQKSGNSNETNSLNQQAQVASARLALAEAEKQQIATRERLNRLMGLWGDQSVWSVRPELPQLPASEPPLARLEKLALTQRRDLRALRGNVDAIGQALALRTNTRYLPAGIEIGVDTEKEPDEPRVTGPTLEVQLPLFDQGQGEIARMAAEYRQAKRQLQALAIQIRSEVREAHDMLKVDRDEVTYYRKTVVPMNVQSVNHTLLQYNAMQVNTYDLFLAKQRELDTERDYIGAWRDFWIARTNLEEAVGGNFDSKSASQR